MSWKTTAEASKILGKSPRTLRDRAALDPAHPHYLIRHPSLPHYWINDVDPEDEPADAPAPEHADAPSAPLEPAPVVPPAPLLEVAPTEPERDGDRYVFDHARDRYIFSLACKAKVGRPFVVPGAQIRSIVTAYSNNGSAATLNELCRTHGWHRATMREVIHALGKTHDSAPFTDEDIATRSEDSLSEDAIRLKEERVLLRAERASWAETQRLAGEARHFDRFVAGKIHEAMRVEGVERLAAPQPVYLPKPQHGGPGFDVVATPTDLHFGKHGWRDEVGEEYNRQITRERLLDTARTMIARVLRYGAPRRWILGAGSDWFHVDTDGATTTRGTPQDTDGTFARIFLEGCALAEEYVELLASVAPVSIVSMAGNHDRLASMMLTHWLQALYCRGADGRGTAVIHRGHVEVSSSTRSRHYLVAGRTLVGITHGEDIKDQDLPSLMAAEAPVEWGQTQHRVIFTGHLHTQITNEYMGTQVIHMPSLSGVDRWHERHGYIGNRHALAAYLVCHEEGLIATLPVLARKRSAT